MIPSCSLTPGPIYTSSRGCHLLNLITSPHPLCHQSCLESLSSHFANQPSILACWVWRIPAQFTDKETEGAGGKVTCLGYPSWDKAKLVAKLVLISKIYPKDITIMMLILMVIIYYLLCARPCSSFFTCLMSFNPRNNHDGWILLIIMIPLWTLIYSIHLFFFISIYTVAGRMLWDTAENKRDKTSTFMDPTSWCGSQIASKSIPSCQQVIKTEEQPASDKDEQSMGGGGSTGKDGAAILP